MNYLTGMILIGTDFNEVMAFTILDKLMRDPERNWASLYDKNLKKLFPLTDHIYGWLLQERPKIEKHFTKNDVPLATLLAGPFMALFANIID